MGDRRDTFAMRLGRKDWSTLQGEIEDAGGWEEWRQSNWEKLEKPQQEALQQMALAERRKVGQINMQEALRAEALREPDMPREIAMNMQSLPPKLRNAWSELQQDVNAIQANTEGMFTAEEQASALSQVRQQQRALIQEMGKYRPPTAQEQFEARRITLPGGRAGYLDKNGDPQPLSEDSVSPLQEVRTQLQQSLLHTEEPEKQQAIIQKLGQLAEQERKITEMSIRARHWTGPDGRTYIMQPDGKIDTKDPPKSDTRDVGGLYKEAAARAEMASIDSNQPVTSEAVVTQAKQIMEERDAVAREVKRRQVLQKMEAVAIPAPRNADGSLRVWANDGPDAMRLGQLYAVDTAQGRMYVMWTGSTIKEVTAEEFANAGR
jgi:hypothetical protein